jgi:hypothetical protein
MSEIVPKAATEEQIAAFDARLHRLSKQYGEILYDPDHLEMIGNLIRRELVAAMKEGSIPYCPNWSLSMPAGAERPEIWFDWSVAVTADWRDIPLQLVN